MAMHYYIDTGPDPTDITHEAAQVRKKGFRTSYAVSLCGVAFQDHDSWAVGFGEHPDERVTCPRCREIHNTTTIFSITKE